MATLAARCAIFYFCAVALSPPTLHADDAPPIVGFSIGGLYSRLYASRYPDEVAGMVIVDHAFIDPGSAVRTPTETQTQPRTKSLRAQRVYSANEVDTPPALISQTPITLGIEDDENFQRLPKLNRELHAWAMSRHPLRPTAETAAECSAEVEKETASQTASLSTKPLVVISTNNDTPGYHELQIRLLALSRNSKSIVAEHSSHLVIIDEPETIVTAICSLAASVRSRAAER